MTTPRRTAHARSESITDAAIAGLCLPSVADLPPGTTKGELATHLYPNRTYDTALPHAWCEMMETRFIANASSHFVWHYPPRGIPYPLPLTKEGATALFQIASLYVDC